MSVLPSAPRFRQVDVFTAEPLRGNPVAVVHDADGLSTEQMQRFAHWTNLSETTFLLPPTDPAADYRLRIFTPAEELPFAGHPTLGSAHAWLEAGGSPAAPGEVVQECGAGLVRLRRGERLAFAAPPLVRSGPASAEERAAVVRALGVPDADVLDARLGRQRPRVDRGGAAATPRPCSPSSRTGRPSRGSRSAWSGGTPTPAPASRWSRCGRSAPGSAWSRTR